MVSAKEIEDLKRERLSLERRMGRIDERQRPIILGLAQRLKELMAEIESTLEKEKSMWNPAVITRIKVAKKGYELSKGLNHFEVDVAQGFEKGDISKDEGKRFIRIAKLIKESKMPAAKDEFMYFEEFTGVCKEYERVGKELEEKEASLRRERIRIERVIAEISELEDAKIDPEKVRRYDVLAESLDKLKTIRERYIDSLLSMPVVELLPEIEKHSPEDYFSGFPAKEEIEGLKRFFQDYPAFGRCDAKQLCEYFTFSEKKLSHVCQETTRFRKVVMGNRTFFETLSSLKQTPFLAVVDEDEKVLDFYSKNIADAGPIVARIRELRGEKLIDMKEHERSERIVKRKAELSGYPKSDLEAQLKGIDHLLGILRSEKPPKDPEEGLLSAFGSFLKRVLD